MINELVCNGAKFHSLKHNRQTPEKSQQHKKSHPTIKNISLLRKNPTPQPQSKLF